MSQHRFVWRLTTSGVFLVRSMYGDLMNGHTRFLRKYLCKQKIPLKIKIFVWFRNIKVLFTKDTLAKRNWNGCKKRWFCDSKETNDHLFLSCPFAHFVWHIVQFTYNLPPPTNSTNMFRNWLNGIDKKTKARTHIGVSALCWPRWNYINNIVFNKSGASNLL
jgi:hypothetical protein